MSKKKSALEALPKIGLTYFWFHQEREKLTILRIDTLPILYDVTAKDSNQAVFLQIAHSKHLLSCLRPTCIGTLVALYQSATKKAHNLQDCRLNLFLRDEDGDFW